MLPESGHDEKHPEAGGASIVVPEAGFIISLVSVLDKKIGSFKQITSARSVKNDLIINAYKPKVDFSSQILCNTYQLPF